MKDLNNKKGAGEMWGTMVFLIVAIFIGLLMVLAYVKIFGLK